MPRGCFYGLSAVPVVSSHLKVQPTVSFLNVCVCPCVYVCTLGFVCVCMDTRVYAYACILVCVCYTHVCKCVCTLCTCVLCTLMCMCICVYMYTCMYVCMHVHSCLYVCTSMCVCEVSMCEWWCVCGSQRKTWKSLLSLSTIRVPGVEISMSGSHSKHSLPSEPSCWPSLLMTMQLHRQQMFCAAAKPL